MYLLISLGCGSSATTEGIEQPLPGGGGSAAGGSGGGTAVGTAGTGGVGVSDIPANTTCNGCLIEGRCYADADRNPANACAICVAASRPSEWSSEADGAACDDLSFCSTDDHCEAGRCAGSPRDCNDDRACTSGERCDDREGCMPGVSVCGQGEGCLASGQCGVCAADQCNIGGTCFEDRQLNPNNSCEICDPALSLSAWSALADGTTCDDELACTSPDTCSGGACTGRPQSCDDGIFCNGAEICVEGGGVCNRLGGTSPCVAGCIESEQRCAPICVQPSEGCACSGAPLRACEQAAGKGRLICDAGVWRRDADCEAGKNCAHATGACETIVAECVDRAAGTRFCAGGFLYACGPDGVESDVQGVESCRIDCVGSVGNASCPPLDDAVEITNVWPPGNVRGGALLIVGKNLRNATEVWVNGVLAPVISHDNSVYNSQKIVAKVPEAASPLQAQLRLVTPDGLSESVSVFIAEQGALQGVAPGPINAYGTIALQSPEPDPPPTYPPVSDSWLNECDPTDIYFVAESDEGVSPAGIRNFAQVDFGNPDSPPAQDVITGFIDMETMLVHMTVTNDDVVTPYVGVYSDTGLPDVLRLVLFPEKAPGRQLVLSVSEGGSAVPSHLAANQCSP